jgi:hypothetical protein
MRGYAIVLLALWSLPPAASAQIITGADVGGTSHVKVFQGLSGTETQSFLAYGSFTGGVRVGAGHLNGDGVAEILTGAGAGAPGGHIKAFDGASVAEIRSFFAFPGFSGGVYVSGGDITGDSIADIIVGAGSGTPGGHVKVFSGVTGAEIRSFFAFAGFSGGVRVGAGDVTGDGVADIITGAGPGGIGGHVKVFDGLTNAEVRSFFAYSVGFTGGVFVGAGDVNGDGIADIITGADEGSLSHVKVFDGATNAEIRSFIAYGGVFAGGVRVGAGDLNGDAFADIITGAGPGGSGHVKVFNGETLAEISSFLAYGPSYTGGVFVAGASLRARQAVPEPTSAALLLLGSLSIVALRLRRQRLVD